MGPGPTVKTEEDTMKRFSTTRVQQVSVAALLALPTLGCGGGGGGGGVVLTGAVITGHVEVLNQGETGVGGITVRLGESTATTNEQGWYLFDDVPASERVVVSARGEGYVGAIETLAVVEGAAYHVDLVLVPVNGTTTVDATTGGSISAAGVEITVPPNAFVNAAGAPAVGAVTIAVGLLDPGAGDQATDAFPGSFEGVARDGMPSLLESFGLFSIDATQGTSELNLAPGRSLAIRAPIAASGLASAPASIPLWSFDEATGAWNEEGTATRAGNLYETTIPHLSWWNFDFPYRDRTTCVTVCFADAGVPVPGVYVHIHMPEVRASVTQYTDSTGCTSLNVRSNSAATLEYSYNSGAVTAVPFTTQALVTSTRARPPMCQDLGVLNIEPVAAQVMLSWGPEPSDLDSHMTGPGTTGRFHTYFGTRGSATSAPFCFLDTDDTSAFGPEVISIHHATSGVYRYSVHNYSGQSSHRLEDASARVVVIVPGLSQVMSFTPPSNPSNGNIWRVFDLHAEGTRILDIVPINDFVNGSATGPSYDP